MVRIRRRIALVACASLVALVVASLGAPAAGAWGGNDQGQNNNSQGDNSQGGGFFPSNIIFVAKTGTDSPTCGPFASPCLTIGQGVTNASNGGTVVVLPGTYAEMVTIDKQLNLLGKHAMIDATGLDNGVLLQGPGANGSKVAGFDVENAIGEGILASGVDNVTIALDSVMHNDQGTTVSNTYPECQAMGQVPGDCGEGVHLQATTNSKVIGNNVSNNAGGILVSDDFAPTSGNLIAFNKVSDNKPDCGITIPSHNASAGVFDNTITMNFVTGNGEGGVLIAAGVAGGAAHDNTVTRNFLENNGFAGVTIHAHFPGSNLNNNVINDNLIRTNNITGDDDAQVFDTTGILVFSGDPSVTITGTQIHRNVITDNHFGIWLSPGLVDSSGISNNTFINVDIDLQQ
jgi:parallel beta-helix repeat protein